MALRWFDQLVYKRKAIAKSNDSKIEEWNSTFIRKKRRRSQVTGHITSSVTVTVTTFKDSKYNKKQQSYFSHNAYKCSELRETK